MGGGKLSRAGRRGAAFLYVPGTPADDKTAGVDLITFEQSPTQRCVCAGEAPTVSITVDAQVNDRFLPQVMAETKRGNRNKVVVSGAH